MTQEQPLTRECTFPGCKRRVAYDYARAMCPEHVQITDVLIDNFLRERGIDPEKARGTDKEEQT